MKVPWGAYNLLKDGLAYKNNTLEMDALRKMLIDCVFTKSEMSDLDVYFKQKTTFTLSDNFYNGKFLSSSIASRYATIVLLNELSIKPILALHSKLRHRLIAGGHACIGADLQKWVKHIFVNIHKMILNSIAIHTLELWTTKHNANKLKSLVKIHERTHCPIDDDVYIFKVWADVSRMCKNM